MTKIKLQEIFTAFIATPLFSVFCLPSKEERLYWGEFCLPAIGSEDLPVRSETQAGAFCVLTSRVFCGGELSKIEKALQNPIL